MTARHFVNLTNGLQAIPEYGLTDYRFIRLQSTACEQKLWADILMQLSDDFLMAAALGHDCVVYDYGAGRAVPRAVWQGLEWVKFVLHRRWKGQTYMPQGRAALMHGYFGREYARLPDRVKARLDYFGKFSIMSDPIRISAVTEATAHDGDTGYYVGVMRRMTC